MNKEMIISSSAHDTRVAILEDDQVVEVFIEREHQRGVVGNIYKGRVSKVLPGMQSAFVDLGLERDAFLYVSDVISPTEEALEEDDDVPALAVEAADAVAVPGAEAPDGAASDTATGATPPRGVETAGPPAGNGSPRRGPVELRA
jgi:ribonuclease G